MKVKVKVESTRVSHKNLEGTKSTKTLECGKCQQELRGNCKIHKNLGIAKNFEACSSRKKIVNLVLCSGCNQQKWIRDGIPKGSP